MEKSIRDISKFTGNYFIGTTREGRNIFRGILLVAGATLAGYTITDYHPKFLDLLVKPIPQFLIFAALVKGLWWDRTSNSLYPIILEALFLTVIVQVFRIIVDYIMESPYSKYIVDDKDKK